MLDVLVVVAFLGLIAYIAIRAFQSPHGVYGRSLATLVGVVAAALALWAFAGPRIAAEAGFGANVVVGAISAIGLFVTVVACLSASLRHLVNAFAPSSLAHEPAAGVRPTAYKNGVGGHDERSDVPAYGIVGGAGLRARASGGGAEHAL